MLSALQNALDRGVKVTIQKDAYGSIFEKAEENKQSLFHKEKQKGIHILAKIVDIGYADQRKPKGYQQLKNPKLDQFLNHPNLTLSTHILKDHTKFYVIDQKILYMGGVNIEDKEDGKDIQGRTYLDYMVRIDDPKEVTYFLSRFEGKMPYNSERTIDYVMNRPNDFQVKNELTLLLNQAKQRILMHMAYFGAKSAMQALFDALNRGVEVTIVTSKVSNLQSEYNLYWMNKLQKAGAIVFLYDGLVHAKAILIDDIFIVGSTNLNNSAYDQLGECSLVVQGDTVLNQSFLLSHTVILSNTIQTNPIKYSKIKSFFEQLLS
jgi:cardiolipin synthase